MKNDPQGLSRRNVLRSFGLALTALPIAQVLGCSSDPVVGGDAGSDAGSDVLSGSDAAVDVGVDAGADVVTAVDAGADVVATDAGAGWITGGTARIASSYPSPFSGSAGTSCTLICQTTIGPCHTTSPMRQDVSDGIDGIPMRLALRVLDEQCQPLSNVIVEIWQTNYSGIYSGNINTMCNTAAADRAAMYFRGYLRTDSEGRVDFNSCFPGWYRGRTIHIHVRVMSGEYNAADNATASVITQLVFSDDLVRSIHTDVPLYATRGQPDTFLASDNIVGSLTDRTPYICDIARMTDGVMMASKTLIVRGASSSTSLCTAGGMGGGMGGGDGGMMMPPGDGGMPPRP